MSGQGSEYNEASETIEYYKIKLMQRERELNEQAAKLKKIEFKNNRDLTELKMAAEKAKQQLKDEKVKLDKATKAASETTQQNAILQHRMNEIKDEKDKEIESVRAQYNALKVEVRSYERILPTLTFMNKNNAKYEQLPTYEEVFLNWKEKSEKSQALQQKFNSYKAQAEEKLELAKKSEQHLKLKKAQIQKQLREDITKLLDLESQVTTLSIERDQLRRRLAQTTQQLQSSAETADQLTEQNKSLQAKLEQIVRVYNTQMQAKEQQTHKMLEQLSLKHEEDIDRITRDYESRENSHLQQLAYFEEEEHRLHDKIDRDKEKNEENFRELLAEVQRMKHELELQKEEHLRQQRDCDSLKSELKEKANLCYQYLSQLGQNEVKIEKLTAEVESLTKKMQSNRDKSSEEFEHAAKEKQELQAKCAELQNLVQDLREQLAEKQQQMSILQSQLEQQRQKGTLHTKINLAIPAGQFTEQPENRLRSNTEQMTQMEKIYTTRQNYLNGLNSSVESEQFEVRSRNGSVAESKRERRKVSAVLYTQQQLESKLADKIREFETRFEDEYQRKMSEKNKEIIANILSQCQQKSAQEINKISAEKDRAFSSLKRKEQQLEVKLRKMTQQLQEAKRQLQQLQTKTSKKYQLLKSDKQTLESQVASLSQELKKERQSISIFKAQNKQNQRTLKQYQVQIENLNGQLDALKKFKEKTEAKQTKEKSVSSESSSVNIKEIIDKYTAQINSLVEEKEDFLRIISAKEKQYRDLEKKMSLQGKDLEKLKQLNSQMKKQNDILHDLLQNERKDRTLRSVPSLAALQPTDIQQEENFKEFYNQAGQKEGQIAILHREVEDLKQEIEQAKQKNIREVQSLEEEKEELVKDLIQMKMKLANSEMYASEKVHLYNQLKKKMKIA